MIAALLLVGAPQALLGSRVLGSPTTLAAPRGARASPCMAADATRRSTIAAAAAVVPAVLLGAPPAAFAGESKANRLLSSLGFPPLPQVDGYSQLAQFIGRASAANIDGQKKRGFSGESPLLVAYNYPSTWVTAMPTITTNGESGTVSAGNYIKGDSSGFVAVPAGGVKSVADAPKSLLAESVVASATGDVYQDVKVSKVQPRGDGSYYTWDYTYTLLTRAGFEVDRHGVGAGTIVNGQLCAVVTATTQLRWKSEETKLRELTRSFVVYPVKKSAIPQIDDVLSS